VMSHLDKYDAEPLVHPEAIYLHHGETYLVTNLDLDRNIATVKKVDVDYYTQPIGGTDIHHIDRPLREKEFGTGRAYFGEVTAYFGTVAYEKILFYTLDALSVHKLDLPTLQLETMAFWITPPEGVVREIARDGLDAHAGLRGVGYATRTLLPLFVTCETLDFSHTVGAANAPWQTVFVYERYPRGLGFTEKAYELLGDIIPAVRDHVRACGCPDGCPLCVGKPLRQETSWNVERGEGHIPSKTAALAVLDGLLADCTNLAAADHDSLGQDSPEALLKLKQGLSRRLQRLREPVVFHHVQPHVPTGYPAPELRRELSNADVARRARQRIDFEKAKKKGGAGILPVDEHGLEAHGTEDLGQRLSRNADVASRARRKMKKEKRVR